MEDVLSPMFDFDPSSDKLGVKPSAVKAERVTTERTPRRKAVTRVAKEPVLITSSPGDDFVEETEASLSPSPVPKSATLDYYTISPGVLDMELPLLAQQERQFRIVEAIWSGADYCKFINLLRFSKYKIEPDFPLDSYRNTPLHWCAALGRLDLARALLKHGANIFLHNKWGESPLVNAVHRSENYTNQTFPSLLKMLKNIVLRIDAVGQSLMHHIVLRCARGHEAAFFYFESLAAWILKKGTRVSGFVDIGDDAGDTALHFATRYRIYRVVEVLLHLGANYTLRNRAGSTSLDLVGGDGRLIAMFGAAASPKRKTGVDKAKHQSESDTDDYTTLEDSSLQTQFVWHGKRPWSEVRGLPITRILLFSYPNQ